MTSTTSTIASQGSEGPLAEFAALRDEIQERVRAQGQLLSLQLTLSGAVFGFAISQAGMTALLLIVPFSSYLLCGRMVAQHFGTLRVAKYITEELSCQVPGGLHWEEWMRRQGRRPHLLGSALPLLLTFGGASVLALGWATGYVFGRDGLALAPHLGLIVVWVAGLGSAALSTVLILQLAGRLPVRSWEQTGLS